MPTSGRFLPCRMPNCAVVIGVEMVSITLSSLCVLPNGLRYQACLVRCDSNLSFAQHLRHAH
jgi:hypothetical protein